MVRRERANGMYFAFQAIKDLLVLRGSRAFRAPSASRALKDLPAKLVVLVNQVCRAQSEILDLQVTKVYKETQVYR